MTSQPDPITLIMSEMPPSQFPHNSRRDPTWEPRPLFEGMDAAVLRAVFEAIRQAPHSPHRQAKNWVGHPLTAIGGRSDKEANSIIKTWLETGVLTVEEYTDEHRHKVDRVMLAECKAAEILAGVETAYALPE